MVTGGGVGDGMLARTVSPLAGRRDRRAASNVGLPLIGLIGFYFKVTVDSWRWVMLVGGLPGVHLLTFFHPAFSFRNLNGGKHRSAAKRRTR